jgi:hypothetical protein
MCITSLTRAMLRQKKAMTTPDHDREPAHLRWYRQPIIWLGAAFFLVSMAGCIWIIVAGGRHTDEALETGHTVLGMPVTAHRSPHAPPASPATTASPEP